MVRTFALLRSRLSSAAPKLLQQVERIQRPARSQRRFVMQMMDTPLQASQTAAAE
jgi:hypothetical protein